MADEFVGMLLKRIRKKKNISQRELSELSGVDRSYIVNLERGNPTWITLPMARKLSKGLGVRPEIFLSTEDSEFLYIRKGAFESILKDLKEEYRIPDDEVNAVEENDLKPLKRKRRAHREEPD